MPVKQRQRFKRRSFAKLHIKRQKEESEAIDDNNHDTIDGDPIFTENDFEDTRITKLLQRRQKDHNEEEGDIFLTDLLDADSDNEQLDDLPTDKQQNDDAEHKEMLEEIFGAQSIQEPTIMGSQLHDDPLDIEINATDLQYLLSQRQAKREGLSQQLDKLEDKQSQSEHLTMSQMIQSLQNSELPMAKSVKRQIDDFDDSQQLQRLKLTAQTKITPLNVERKQRALQMDSTRKEMQSWSQAVTLKKEKLTRRRNLIPPQNNMLSFMENMEWNGNLGKELQGILDDYSRDNDLDEALAAHKPSRQEVVKQAKKMADMRRQIANQIKEFKRIKKIKSRAFRKRLRARKAKITPSLQELQEIDPKLYKREVSRMMRQRAEERVTLKHKNTTKWAKQILRRGRDGGKIDVASRKALMEQLQRGKELRRKIKGLDSDEEDDSDAELNGRSGGKKRKQPRNTEFETEVESETRKREEMLEENKQKGIWGMKFMKDAESKRREHIKTLTESAQNARSFDELDRLEMDVNRIEQTAHKINPLITAADDPVGAYNHEKKLDRLHREKQEEIHKAHTILGKRKYGFSSITNDIADEPVNKKMKHKVLDIDGEAKTKIVDNTQMIEESTFGKGSKSVIHNVNVRDEDVDGLVTEDTLKNSMMTDGVFEMVEFPKHDNRVESISDINRKAERKPDRKELETVGQDKYNKLRKNQKIQHQRFYVDDEPAPNEVVEENEKEKEEKKKVEAVENDGWSVVLDANTSVNDVYFGTLGGGNCPKKVVLDKGLIQNKQELVVVTDDDDDDQDEDEEAESQQEEEDLNAFVDDDDEEDEDEDIQQDENEESQQEEEDLNAFVDDDEEEDEDEDIQQDEDEGTNENGEIRSILIKNTRDDSKSNRDKRVKWSSNSYSDGNPHTKFHSPVVRITDDDNTQKTTNKKDAEAANPWLASLSSKPSKKQKTNTETSEQAETTQFDPAKILIPKTQRKTPDFNLLQTKDPKQIDMIHEALQSDGKNNNEKLAEFIPNDNNEEEFRKLKEKVMEDAMPDAPEGALQGWDHWTGYGIADDAAFRDAEYLQAKALWEKKKKQMMANRSDGHLSNVILSDEISRPSSKYVLKRQPEWVNMSMYRHKMKDTLGREWNLSTEFFNAIKPDMDIPHGYMIQPTSKEKEDQNDEGIKTSFGEKYQQNEKSKGTKTTPLQSVYKGNVHDDRYGASKRNSWERPERAKI
eukprot:CAMPEP_0197077158 /NCGR_PEP_ID=MMETSP1384-20130603/212474_1 /TAXON_ID=29189 /ORGANISM="Ammonia sp." /LENGTH=1213 /DNA_ID=CAMNT_0042516017 /DNA_START=28 /DNA_END=3669 /DNA_ORIENTATION=+